MKQILLALTTSIALVNFSGCSPQTETSLEPSTQSSTSEMSSEEPVAQTFSSDLQSPENSSSESSTQEYSTEEPMSSEETVISSSSVPLSSEFDSSSITELSSSSLSSSESSSSELSSSIMESSSSIEPCTKTVTSGREWVTINVDGTDRKVLYIHPKDQDPNAYLPMTFSLHGSGGTPEGNISNTNIESLASQYGYIVALIEAHYKTWNTPQDDSKPHDVRFATKIIEHARDNFCLDTNRVFSTGFSGGGRTTSRIACDIPEKIRAIAPVAGVRYDEPCVQHPVPIMTFHSKDDNVNPYNGNGNWYWGESVEGAVNDWKNVNGCSDEMTTVSSIPGGELRSWVDCTGEAEVHFYVIDNKKHSWEQVEGTTEKILQFFDKFQ